VKGLDFSFRFDAWFERLPRSPRDVGRVCRCVLRTGPGQRATPERVEVAPGEGVLGDAWKHHEHSLPGNEVALINVNVINSLADGDPTRTPLSGDNFHVDLDLSEDNLPTGTRLHVGEAVLLVSDTPHRPCLKFVRRFGTTAAKRVARANRRGRRGRGVVCTVERGGAIAVGDEIRVQRPA
jgi:MOSC domain-containing protein YiiM